MSRAAASLRVAWTPASTRASSAFKVVLSTRHVTTLPRGCGVGGALTIARSLAGDRLTVVNAMQVAPAQQVILKVRFLEVSRTAGRNLGVNWFVAELILVIMVIYVTMVYGPIAAFLVELFPTKIRYTSMSLPYHIGNGWFGGMLPLLATAIVAAYGNIYAGLWYPIVVALMTAAIGFIFLRETKDTDIAKT